MKRNIREKRNAADLACILKLPQGRRLIWRILQACRLDEHGFVPGDNASTAFHCGQRSIGLFLQTEILQISALLLAQMRAKYMSESTSEQKKINQEIEKTQNV